jgi:CRISPR/Cas system-associated endonuclease Cas3-HD
VELKLAITVNMAKARMIHMNNIRAIRDRELAAKDITFMRAVEDGNADAQTTIKNEKQNLRDIPQTFDITTGVDTPEQLKAKWPDGLPKE